MINLKICRYSKRVVSTPPYETTPRGGGMSGPFNIEENCETSELLYNLLNLTGFISDPMQKLVELAHLMKSGRRDYEGSNLEPRILKDFRFEFKRDCYCSC